MPHDLSLDDPNENSLYVDPTYAEVLIIEINGEAVELTIEQAQQLIDAVGGWIAFQKA